MASIAGDTLAGLKMVGGLAFDESKTLWGGLQAPTLCLSCPICDGQFAHITRVYTRTDKGADEGGAYEGTQEVLAESGWCWRRSALVIEVDGECGDRWAIVIQQHKGENPVWVEILFIAHDEDFDPHRKRVMI